MIAANTAERPQVARHRSWGWLRHPNAAAALGTPRPTTTKNGSGRQRHSANPETGARRAEKDRRDFACRTRRGHCDPVGRSEEHTSELQSQSNLVCRLLLE